jgi:hypothetical protein
MAATALTGSLALIVRTSVHPFILKTMGSSPAALAHPVTVFDEKMAPYLPQPSDSRGILDFFGLDSVAAQRTLQAAAAVDAHPGKVQDKATGSYDFPRSNALLRAYIESTPRAPRVPDTYDAWFACAQTQGLRPEFACNVGLHPTDPRYGPDHADFYVMVSPENASRDKVVSNKFMLDALWRDRIKKQGAGAV